MKTDLNIILVHGFWGGAAHWSKVIVDLAKRGYKNIRAVEMPLISLASMPAEIGALIDEAAGDLAKN
ncbi:hypothetical protein [Pedobacter steynii]